jgi:hypothetical protein
MEARSAVLSGSYAVLRGVHPGWAGRTLQFGLLLQINTGGLFIFFAGIPVHVRERPPIRLNNANTALAQLDMDEKHWADARAKLREASRGFAAAELRTGEADTQALLALCAQALGESAERDSAIERARVLRQAMTSRQEVYVVDIALAQLAAANATDAAAGEKLLALATDAERRHFIPWALEARVAAWRILQARGAGAAAALRAEIEKTARQHGFARILRLLRERAGE